MLRDLVAVRGILPVRYSCKHKLSLHLRALRIFRVGDTERQPTNPNNYRKTTRLADLNLQTPKHVIDQNKLIQDKRIRSKFSISNK